MHRSYLPLAVALASCLTALTATAQPTNSITISDQSGSTQTNRPFTISRIFAQGDIPNYAQASIGGTTVPTQCDVKTRWPDGSVQHAVISFLATVPSNGTITVSFVNQSGGNNSGAMSRADMLTANWGAQINVTNGTALSANARQIVTDWSGSSTDARVTYWLQGPICTQVILEDRSQTLAYDMGWDSYKPLHPIFVVTFYPGYSSGVKVEMILENMWTTKLEDQTYSVTLQTGNPLGAAVYSKSNFTHISKTRWRKIFWSGTQPGSVNINYNLAYMTSTMAFPNWDPTKIPSSGTISSDASNFSSSDQGDLGGHALWTQTMGNTGGRYDIGVFPVWYVHYLYTFSPSMNNLMSGMPAVGAYVPIHLRESASGKFFDSAHSVNALGRPISIDARPTVYSDLTYSGTAGTDKVSPVGATTGGGWTYDLAHEPAFNYVPYVLTGDWYYLEEIYFNAAFALTATVPDYVYYGRGQSLGYLAFSIQTRGQAWGLRDIAEAAFVAPDGTPEKAYFTQKLNNNIAIEEGAQDVVNGAFPPSNPSCPGYTAGPGASQWCYGRITIGEAIGNDFGAPMLTNPLHLMNIGNAGDCGSETHLLQTGAYVCENDDRPWEHHYKYGVLGHIQELGFPIGPLNQVQFLELLHMVQDPAFNPWLVGVYNMPTLRASTNQYYQTWADMLQDYNPAYTACGGTRNFQTMTGWPECGSNDSDFTDPGYPHIAKGAVAYLAQFNVNDGALLGVNAWNWMVANVTESGAGANPQWEVLPRNVAVRTAASACDLNSDGVVNAQDVQIEINMALGTSGCNGGLTGSGTCTVVDVQRVTNAALGGSCRLGP